MDTDELVGRDPILAALSDAVAVVADRGDALLIVGEAGSGKTACLLAAAAMAGDAGHLLLQTAGHAAESSLPFAGLHRLLRPILGSTDGLPDVQRRALLGAFGLHDGRGGDHFLVSVATVNLLRRQSEHRSLVITADDLQFLDKQTQRVLAFVAHRLDYPVLIVGTSSSTQGLPAIRDSFRAVSLDRLNESTARRLLALRAPALTPGQREWVVGRAAGNPLALIELAKSPESVETTNLDPFAPSTLLSPTLERAFARRLDELPQRGRDAVLVAAVAADASLSEILAAITWMSGQSVTPAILEPAQALGLLAFDEERVDFTHPLIAAAVVQREPISRRQAAHRALGAVITVNSLRRAWHRALGSATYDDTIAAELEATTADTIRRGDTTAAIMALERAAQLSTAPAERGRRLLLAARQAARVGEPGVVDRLLGGVATSDLSAFDRVRAELARENFGGTVIADSNRVIQLCSVAEQAVAAGEMVLAVEVADAAVRRRCAAPVDAPALAQMSSLARRLHRSINDAHTVAVLALADPVGHGRAVLSILADVDESTVTDGEQLNAYGVAARAVGHYSTASKLLDRAEVVLRPRGLLGPLARNLCVAAELHLELGEWDRAAAALEGFAALSAASMSASHRATALATTAKLAALRGDTSTALELVSEAEHSPLARSGSRYLARAQIVRGIACISADKQLDAYAALSRVFEPDDPSHHFREQFDAVAYLAEAAAHTSHQDQATDVVDRMQLIADVSGAPALMAHLSYARAVLASDDVAEELFLACLASDAAGSPWQRARVQLAYGRWLRRQYHVTRSREPLQAALTILQRLGALRWAKEALDELEASGARNEQESGVPALNLLSVQESKVARLASQGLSNREIGQQLHISARTVSSHLYRIFPKLGISTRAQIAARLNEVHPVGDGI